LLRSELITLLASSERSGNFILRIKCSISTSTLRGVCF
jgi:hypothetical protein